jgi:hypothetical protein
MNVLRKFALAGAMAGATLGGAALGAVTLGTASAQTATTTPSADSSTATTAPSSGSTGATAPADGSAKAAKPSGPHQANGKTETLLTGDDLAKVTAAVQTTVPGATIDRAETDADGATYEAHITKSDGSKATVKFDANFNVTSVDAGMT